VRLYLALALSAILAVTALQYSRLTRNRQSGVFDVEPKTPYFHYSPAGSSRGRVLLVHGLDANKELMNPLGFALADAGFDVYAIDLPGHGASHTPFTTELSREVVAQVLDRLGAETVVIGHSLGGGLLLDLANERTFGSMVLFSPAPTPIGEIHANRVLLYVAQFDIPRIREFSDDLVDAVSGTVEFHDLAWTGHNGPPSKPQVIAEVIQWLGGDAHSARISERLVLLAAMFLSSIGLGIVMLGPPVRPPAPAVTKRPIHELILYYFAAAAAAALILNFISIAAWLHLFVTDYLIGFLFVAGSLLCAIHFREKIHGIPLVFAILAAAYVIAVPGIFVASNFTHLMLFAGRWWRFAGITALSLPFFVADEILLRPIRPQWKAALTALVTRAIIWATVISVALLWKRDAAFLLLIMHIIVAFWMLLWFAGGLAYRKIRDPFAVGLFISLLQGWLFASLFVIV
jgi:pimeloyl-ACP methyl ester carboxylesterase